MSHEFLDVRALAVVRPLHARGRREIPTLLTHFLTRAMASWLKGHRFVDPDARDMEFLSDKLMPLAPAKCDLCYALCRALRATRVVEVGTSFAVSTIYLAAAVRDTLAESGGEGRVIGTEVDARKVAIARRHLAQAGLETLAEIREGNALETLKAVVGPVDFVLLDTWIPLALPALKLLQPHLRHGAIVACDNTTNFAKDYAPYLEYVNNPQNGFRSVATPYRGGLHLSVRCN